MSLCRSVPPFIRPRLILFPPSSTSSSPPIHAHAPHQRQHLSLLSLSVATQLRKCCETSDSTSCSNQYISGPTPLLIAHTHAHTHTDCVRVHSCPCCSSPRPPLSCTFSPTYRGKHSVSAPSSLSNQERQTYKSHTHFSIVEKLAPGC